MFQKYNKIHRLGAEETEGILDGLCYIQEKVDGANVQIWMEDGFIRCGSRSKQITEGFNGFIDYVMTNEPIKKLLTDRPEFRLYGEWLVRHTIHYKETSYKKFYLFDITMKDMPDAPFLRQSEVAHIAEQYSIPHPQIFAEIDHPTIEQINEFVGKSSLGEVGEGVVIKRTNFVDKFGEKRHAKVVSQQFKEDNGIVFGGNNKHSDTYEEMYIVNKYMTLERVKKVMHKLQPMIDKKLDMEHTARVINTAYHDMLTEEIWAIQKDSSKIDLKALARLSQRKAAQIYKDLLSGEVSVADRKN